MSFMMMGKKKFKFLVEIEIDKLTDIPFVNAVLFAKLRLEDGGKFEDHTNREEVKSHVVTWSSTFSFECKMHTNSTNGVLNPCFCRISIRKEVNGGKSCQKLGYVRINLAELAGSGKTSKTFLLHAYNEKHRLDNSLLNVAVKLTLKSGDICFKVPTVTTASMPGENQEDSVYVDKMCNEIIPTITNDSESSTEDGTITELPESGILDDGFELGHSRHSSNTSQWSKASGPSSVNSNSQHSRQSSSGDSSHTRNLSSSSGPSDTGSFDRSKDKRKKEDIKDSRMESTRPNANELINELIKGIDSGGDDSTEISGLQLFVAKDKVTVKIGNSEHSGIFQPVIIEKR